MWQKRVSVLSAVKITYKQDSALSQFDDSKQNKFCVMEV